jgi:hypothetical protein
MQRGGPSEVLQSAVETGRSVRIHLSDGEVVVARVLSVDFEEVVYAALHLVAARALRGVRLDRCPRAPGRGRARGAAARLSGLSDPRDVRARCRAGVHCC